MTTLPNITVKFESLIGLLVLLLTVFIGVLLASILNQAISKKWRGRHRKVSEAEDHSEKMLASAREESLAIIKSAHEQARKILAETSGVSSQLNDLAHTSIQNSLAEKTKLLEASLAELQKQFSASLSGIQSDYITRYKKAIKAIEEDASDQVKKMREFFESETSSSNENLQSMTKQGLKIVQSNLEDYERDQKQKIDTIIYDVLREATEDVVGKSLSLEGHQDLITTALEEAKKRNAFS